MGCSTWPDSECVDSASDWYLWVTDPGIVGDPSLYVTGEPVANGPDMWELFEQDVDRMRADGMTTYRKSVVAGPVAFGSLDVLGSGHQC